MFYLSSALILIGLFIFWRFFFFFRNPQRKIPYNDNHILSPADGFILYIKEVNPKDNKDIFSIKKKKNIKLHELMNLPEEDLNKPGYLFGIFMSPFDVHYNRAPIAGEIQKLVHEYPSRLARRLEKKEGKNLSMFNAQSNLFFNEKPFTHDCDYLITNERASYVLKNDRLTLYFTQIADNWVNKIVTFKNGEPIKQGERFGMIRMGSQVDIFVPKLPKMKILVRERQHVKAGLTPLIELQNNN